MKEVPAESLESETPVLVMEAVSAFDDSTPLLTTEAEAEEAPEMEESSTAKRLLIKNEKKTGRLLQPNLAVLKKSEAEAQAKAQAKTASSRPAAKYYAVRRGDTLSHIAKRHGCSVAALKKSQWSSVRQYWNWSKVKGASLVRRGSLVCFNHLISD